MTSSPELPVSSPYGAPGTTPHSASKKNIPGRISLIIGAVIILVGAIFLVVQPLILYSDSRELFPVFALVSAIIRVGLALTGLVFGLIGAVSRGKPKLSAGIGIGIAASELLGTLVSLLSSSIFSAL